MLVTFLTQCSLNLFYLTLQHPLELQETLKHLSIATIISDCQQITFVTYNRLCPLSKKKPPLVLNGQYQDKWKTNQNQMKNNPLFVLYFKFWRLPLMNICKIHHQTFDFLLLYISLSISRHHFSQIIRTSLSGKNICVTNFPFITNSLYPLTPLMAKIC